MHKSRAFVMQDMMQKIKTTKFHYYHIFCRYYCHISDYSCDSKELVVNKMQLVRAKSDFSFARKRSKRFAANLPIYIFEHCLNLSVTSKNLWKGFTHVKESGGSHFLRSKWSDFFSHSKQRVQRWNWASTRIRLIWSFSINSFKPHATYQYLSSHGWRAHWVKNGLSRLLTLMAK